MGTFGYTLKAFRQRLGRDWTQERLGYEVGVSRNTVSNWESGKYLPGRDMVLYLAEKLFLSLEETNTLLFETQYTVESQIKKSEQAPLTQIVEAKVERMVVEHLELPKPTRGQHQSMRGDFYDRIRLPANYIERVNVLTSVRTALLGKPSTIALTSSVSPHTSRALHGMGGIGKTVIARTLCNDPLVQSAFPDGILWATLGQAPDLVPKMREWIEALGGTTGDNVHTLESLKEILAKLLAKRACLLILDDVWRYKDAEAFHIGGPKCCLLLTTRKAEIADKLNAVIHAIPVMTLKEAIRLLEEWANGNLAGVGEELKGQIVKRLGNLPLAIKLAGAQMRHKSPVEWLRTFDIGKLKYREIENHHDSLELTFGLSLAELNTQARGLYAALAIFKEDEATPQVGIEHLWSGLVGLDHEPVMDLLDDFASRGLLEVTIQETQRFMRMHDLLRDLAQAELDDKYQATHQILLQTYRVTKKGVGWHTANDDGYLYNHLAYHLQASGSIDELRKLFSDQQWLFARVAQSGNTYEGYTQDLYQAWACTHAETMRAIEANEEPRTFAECVRYAVILTSIRSIAKNYIPEIVGLSVEDGLWTPQRAISLTATIPNAQRKAKMCEVLLRTKGLSREQVGEVCQIGIQAMQELQYGPLHNFERIRALASLVPFLPTDQCFSLLQQELESMSAERDEYFYAQEVAHLISLLPEEWRIQMLARGLEAVHNLTDEEKRAKVLATIAPYLTDNFLAEGLKEVLAFTHEKDRAHVFAALAPQLSSEQHSWLLKVALGISDEHARTELLIALIPHLKAEQCAHLMEYSLTIVDEECRTQVLASLIPHLSTEQRAFAQHATLTLNGQPSHARIVATLVPFLSKEERSRVLEDELEAVLAQANDWNQLSSLTALIPQLTVEQLTQVLEFALAVSNDWQRGLLLEILIPRLIAEQLGSLRDRLLTAIFSFPYEWGHMEHFIFVSQVRVRGLAELIPQLPKEQRISVLKHELQEALAITDEANRAEVLSTLIPQLDTEQHIELVERELKSFLVLTKGWRRVRALRSFMPLLTEQQLARVLEDTITLSDEVSDAEVFVGLAPYLNTQQCYEALETVRTISNESVRVKAVAALTFQLTSEQHKQEFEQELQVAVDLAARLSDTEAFCLLVPQLTASQLDVALQLASKITNNFRRTVVLKELIPRLSVQQQNDILEKELKSALTLSDSEARDMLRILAPHLTEKNLLECALELVRAFTDEYNRDLGLACLAPQLLTQEHASWREAAYALISQWDKIILVDTMPRLNSEQRSFVLETALNLKNEQRCGEVLAALIPQLNSEHRSFVLEAALNLSDDRSRAEVLASLFPFIGHQVGQDQVPILLRSIRQTMIAFLLTFQDRTWSRDEFWFRYFIKEVFVQPIFSREILGAIVAHIVEICETWTWL